MDFSPSIFDLTPASCDTVWTKKTSSEGKFLEKMGQILKQPINRVWKDLNSAGACLRQETLAPGGYSGTSVPTPGVHIVHHFFDCLAFWWPGHWFQSGSRLILNMFFAHLHELLEHVQTRCKKKPSRNDVPTRLDIAMLRAVGSTKAELEPFLCSRRDDWSDAGGIGWVLCGLGQANILPL